MKIPEAPGDQGLEVIAEGISICFYLCLLVYLLYLSIYLSIYVSIYLSIYLCFVCNVVAYIYMCEVAEVGLHVCSHTQINMVLCIPACKYMHMLFVCMCVCVSVCLL